MTEWSEFASIPSIASWPSFNVIHPWMKLRKRTRMTGMKNYKKLKSTTSLRSLNTHVADQRWHAKVGAEKNCERAIASHRLWCEEQQWWASCWLLPLKQIYCRVGGTIFPHKDIHKLIWRSPDILTTNQIDNILINRYWCMYRQDVKVLSWCRCQQWPLSGDSLLQSKEQQRVADT